MEWDKELFGRKEGRKEGRLLISCLQRKDDQYDDDDESASESE